MKGVGGVFKAFRHHGSHAHECDVPSSQKKSNPKKWSFLATFCALWWLLWVKNMVTKGDIAVRWVTNGEGMCSLFLSVGWVCMHMAPIVDLHQTKGCKQEAILGHL